MTRTKLTPRATRLAVISQFENRLKHMLHDFSTEIVNMSPEDQASASTALDEHMDSMRQELHDALANSFSEEVQKPDNAKAYEEILFSAVDDRLQRYLGYYHALTRISQYIHDFNNQVGDQALTFKSSEITNLLEKVDEVYVIRHITSCLLEKPDADRIVNHIIDREFARRDLR